MSRGQFLRTAAVGAAGLAGAAMFGGGVVSAAPNDLVVPEYIAGGGMNYNVFPTGIAITDVSNVQWAVDNVRSGGTVRLHGVGRTGEPRAFNFGEGSVKIIRKAPSVEGPVTITGQPGATIIGGYPAFESPLLDNGGNKDAVFTIQNIHFMDTIMSAVVVYTCAEANILNNKIEIGVTAAPHDIFFFATGRYGILVNDAGVYYPQKGSIGNVNIIGNDITCFAGLGTGGVQEYNFYSCGIIALRIQNESGGPSNLAIQDNTLHQPGHVGILITGTATVDYTLVQGNIVNQEPTSYYKFNLTTPTQDGDDPFRAGDCIRIQSAGVYGGHCGPVDVIGNILSGSCTTGIGVRDARADLGTIVNLNNNQIEMVNPIFIPSTNEGARGIYIGVLPQIRNGYDYGSNGVTGENNIISGDSYYGIFVEGGANGYSYLNKLHGTQILFEPRTADIYFNDKTYDNEAFFTGITCAELTKIVYGTGNVVKANNILCP